MNIAHVADMQCREGRFAVIAGEYCSKGKVIGRFAKIREALAWMKANGYTLPSSQPGASASTVWGK